jgi:hypothetical protein
MAYATPRITFSSGFSPATFKFTFQFAEMDPGQQGVQRNGSCWRSLFRNPIIVEGYPILARTNKEKGLEIPLNIMAGLGQASRATNFDGGLVIKGHSTMFCPTQRIKDSVLWHYLFNQDKSRMSYLFADTIHRGRALLHEVDMACLSHSRNFLGWCSSAEIHAGMLEGVRIVLRYFGANIQQDQRT